MNYRQWKKKYKKEHGYNPPITADRRKQVKIKRRIDIDKAMELMAQSFRIFAEECGKLIANIGKLLKEAADTIEKKTIADIKDLEIIGNIFDNPELLKGE